jgi:pilus assembly protein FimV
LKIANMKVVITKNMDFTQNPKHPLRFTRRLAQAHRRALIVFAGMVFAISANAVGLGAIQLQSALGQPLQAQIGLISANDVDLDGRCYKARVTSLEGSTLGNTIITMHADGSTPTIVVTTTQSINEPALTLSVEYACASKTRRDYQVLLDFLPTTPAVVEPSHNTIVQNTAEKHSAEVVMQPPGVAIGGDTASASKKPKRHRNAIVAKQDNEYATDTPASAIDDNVSLRKKSSGKPKSARSVLRLDSNDSGDSSLNDTTGMRLVLSSSLHGTGTVDEEKPAQIAGQTATQEVPPSASANDVQVSTVAAKAESMTHPTDTGLQELQAKIRVLEAEAEELKKRNAKELMALEIAQKGKSTGGPLLYLYFMLFASFLAIGWLVWRTRQIQSEINHSSWHEIVPEQYPDEEYASVPMQQDTFTETLEREPEVNNVIKLKQVPEPKTAGLPEVEFPAVTPSRVGVTAPVEESTEGDYKFYSNVRTALPAAEEILDEIQQAEFWMDMQQPQRAIEILESNWKGGRPGSPMPWLYLFDLYRMVGDQGKYEELAERFGQIFNGRVIPWDGENAEAHSRSLEEFPFLMKKIIQLWPTAELVPFLESLLTDDRDGRRQGFDLAAYRDILFLTNIAYGIQDAKDFSKAPQVFPEWSAIT